MRLWLRVSGWISAPLEPHARQTIGRRGDGCRKRSTHPTRCALERCVLPPGQFGGVSIPPTANVPCAPHRTPANLASGDSGHADTTNQCPTRSAEEGDLRGYAVRLMKRRWRHGLRRRCDGQGKSSNSDQPEHWLSPMFGFKHRSRLVQATLDANQTARPVEPRASSFAPPMTA